MRVTIFITCLCYVIVLPAQIVGTFAGIRDASGFIDGPGMEATFYNPHGIAVSQLGNVYVCDRFNHIIRKITPQGMVSTIAGNPGVLGDADGVGAAALFYEPWGVCVDQDENVFVADTRNNKIKKIAPDGLVTTYAGTGNFGITNGALNASTFGQPVGIESDGAGNIYVVDHATNIIRKISAEGMVSTLAGIAYETGDQDGPGSIATFNKPYGLTLDLNGNILIADEWNHKIRKITPAGEVSTVAGTGVPGGLNGDGASATFHYPWDIAVDSLGNIFVVDGLNYAVRKIDPTGAVQVSTLAGTIGSSGNEDGIGTDARFSGAAGIAYSPLTRELFVGDAFNNLIRRITDPEQGVFLTINAIAFCPEDSVLVGAHPNVYDQFNFYLDDVLMQSSASPYFNFLELNSGMHSLKVEAKLDTFQIVSEYLNFEIFNTNPATIDTVGTTTFFEGDSVILIASFGLDYFWSNGEITPTITVKESGEYSVEVSDQNNCISVTDAIAITVRTDLEPIIITALDSTSFCAGGSVQLISNYEENNQWFKDGWPIAEAQERIYKVTNSGIYQAQFTDPMGTTTISDPIEVEVLPAPILDFRANFNQIKPNEDIQFVAITENVDFLEWNFGEANDIVSTIANPVYQYDTEGVFDVSLYGINENGCGDILIKNGFIEVSENAKSTQNDDDIFIATAFTPNGDGVNDILFVRGTDVADMAIKIFNSRGILVFESSAKDTGWDGWIKNKRALPGNYFYQLHYANFLGQERQITGKITLLK